MTSAEDQNVSLTDFPQVDAAENSFARAASISRDFARVTSAEDRTFARLLSVGVDFERLMSDLALRVRAWSAAGIIQPSPSESTRQFDDVNNKNLSSSDAEARTMSWNMCSVASTASTWGF